MACLEILSAFAVSGIDPPKILMASLLRMAAPIDLNNKSKTAYLFLSTCLTAEIGKVTYMNWKKSTFAARFLWARKKKSLTQTAVAKKIGVTRNAISYWENGQNEAEGRNLERAAKALEVSKGWLDTGKGSPEDRHVVASDRFTAIDGASIAAIPQVERILSPESLIIAAIYDDLSLTGKTIVDTAVEIAKEQDDRGAKRSRSNRNMTDDNMDLLSALNNMSTEEEKYKTFLNELFGKHESE